MQVKFYDSVDDALLKFAVIISKTEDKWVFCKHKERDTFEVPGGHREDGESIDETAKRELQEETGAEELHSEMEKVVLFDELPTDWTYPLIQPKLIDEARRRGFLKKNSKLKK